jgi:transposase
MTIRYIGVDVSKETLEVAYTSGSQQQSLGQLSNDPAGWADLNLRLAQLDQAAGVGHPHLILEATGGYEKQLLAYAHQQGWRFSLVNPKQVREWAKGVGYRAKTDRVDAKMLAHFGAQQQPSAQDLLPEAVQPLAYLLERQQDLEKLLRQEANRLEALAHQPNVPPAVETSLKQVIESLTQSLKTIQTQITDLINQHPQLQAKRKILLTIPGVGLRIVNDLLLFLYRWQAFSNGQGQAKGLTAFSGLDPQPYESGRTVHKPSRISKMGDGSIRSQLYMGALGGSRSRTSPLGLFYRSLVDRGKAKKIALVASARKILVWSWAIFQSDTPFDPAKARPKAA